jgi:hypothetical protein
MRSRKQVWVFVVLLLSGLSVNVSGIGQVYISELFLLSAMLLFFPRVLSSINTEDKKMVKLFTITILATAISGVINSTEAQLLLKGVLFLATLLVIYLVVSISGRENPKILVLYFLFFQVGQLVGLWIQPSSLFQGDSWKFGYAYPLTGVMVFFIDRYVKSPFFASFNFLLLATVNLIMGTRNLALVCFIGSFLIIYLRGNQKRTTASKLNFLLVTLVALILAFSLYSNLAFSGKLGEAAYEKYVSQANSGAGLIRNSRPELNIALSTLATKPIVGFGPFPRLNDSQYSELISSSNYQESTTRLDYLLTSTKGNIPSHSAILQFWLWGGVLALALPLFWLTIAVKSFRYFAGRPFVVFVASLFIWDLLFSPFGANKRLYSAIILSILLVGINNFRIKESDSVK